MATLSPPRRNRRQDKPEVSASPSVPTAIEVSPYFRWKGFLDRSLAVVLLVPGVPIMAAVYLLVRLSSCGAAVFRQVRVGKNGRHFVMFKFRTMVDKAESSTGPVWASPNDPRLTRVGAILRKMHLDELPQLWNVVRGDMALVGPRPERPEFTHILAEQIPGFLDRLQVLPGVTGLAQANLPPDTDLDSVRRKLVLDREYVRGGGPWLDARLLVYTVLRVLLVPSRPLMWALRLSRHVELPAASVADFSGEDQCDASSDCGSRGGHREMHAPRDVERALPAHAR